MPSLEASRRVSLQGYSPVKPQQLAAPPVPLVPVLPADLTTSPVMISSVPSNMQYVDGITRQFNGRGHFPVRRLVSPAAR